MDKVHDDPREALFDLGQATRETKVPIGPHGDFAVLDLISGLSED